jgi:hypothetical protein
MVHVTTGIAAPPHKASRIDARNTDRLLRKVGAKMIGGAYGISI